MQILNDLSSTINNRFFIIFHIQICHVHEFGIRNSVLIISFIACYCMDYLQIIEINMI